MSAFRSRLFWKAFLSLLLALLVWLPVFFWLTVPLVNRLAYEIEENASRTMLDSAMEIVSQSHRDLEAWRLTALEAHRRELKNIVLVLESWTRQLEADVAAGKLSKADARQQILERLRQIRYGNNDYLWAADYRSVLVSHPDAEMQGRDASGLRDAKGSLVIPPMVQQARKAGEGYFSYWWSRLDTGRQAEKLSYFRDFPTWQLVIGTGVYIDDVEQETARRRAAMLEDLRKHLHGIKVANSGYVFVIDGKMNAIVHPDPQQEGKSMAGVIDPATGKPLGEEFIEAAKRPNKTVAYRWSKPDDPEHKIYDKVAWIDYFPEFDWYLGASAYAEDLGRSGNVLTGRILIAFVLGLFITALLALAFISSLTKPILHLAAIAQRHMAGDLSAVSGIRRNDEIGVLAEAFDNMVGRLKEQIETLEQRVEERTREIAEWAVQLEALVSVRTAEVRASEAKFRGLVDQSLAGIFVVQDGVFRYANAEFGRIFGYADPSEMISGRGLDGLAIPGDRDRLAAIRRSLSEGEMASSEFAFTGRRRDGQLVDVEVSAHVFDYEKRPAIIGVALDFTERKRAEAAREAALAAAEHLSRLKSEFMANMSHELKTPLNAVIGFAHIGQHAGDLSKAQDVCGHIADAGRQLLRLVENVLDFSSLETGALRLKPMAFNLFQLIQDVSAGSRKQARAKGLDFRLAADVDHSQCCWADAARLGQVIGILLENAVKFTEKGGITLSTAWKDDVLHFSIADTGIGMAQDEVDRLFRPFEQMDGSSTRHYGGMGLGMALAERLLALMDGSIKVESRPGEGTTVIVRLPVAGTTQAPEPVALALAEDRDYSI